MTILALALLAAPVQVARPPSLTVPGIDGPLPTAPATYREITAVIWMTSGDLELRLSAGQALYWGSLGPSLVASGSPTTTITPVGVGVTRFRPIVAWTETDAASGATVGFVRAYHPAGNPAAPAVPVPAPADSQTTALSLAAFEHADRSRVHVASLVRVEPPGASARDELQLATSVDVGESFGPPIVLQLGDGHAPHDLTLVHGGGTLHAIWRMDAPGKLQDQLFHARSSDGGLSWDLGPTPLTALSSAESLVSYAIAARDDIVAVSYWSTSIFNTSFVQTRVSTDGGASFSPAGMPAGASKDDALRPAVAITASGAVVVAFEHQPFLGSAFHIATTRSIGGGPWSPPVDVSLAPGAYPEIVAAPDDRDRVALSWNASVPRAALSHDDGAAWEAPIDLGSGPLYFTGRPRLAYNARYQNVIAQWVTESSGPTWTMLVGGFRPQTFTPEGFVAGPTSVGGTFEHFGGGSLGIMVISTALGSLLLPDSRTIGLSLSPLMVVGIDLLGAGFFLAPLDATGNGITTPLPVVLPPGLSIFATGVAIDVTSGAYGDISDVVPLVF